MNHFLWIDQTVKLFFCNESELGCGLLQREIIVQFIMTDLVSFVIANDGRKGGH